MIKNTKTLFLVTLTILFFVSSASAQGTWTYYTEEDGIVKNNVEEMEVVDEELVYSFPVKDDENLVLFGFKFPLDFMNGMQFSFVKGSIVDDIDVHVSLPGFAAIDDELKQILYFANIISAVSFDVSVNGEFISPYTFGVPIEVSIPFDVDKLAEIGLTPYDLTMMFVTSEGDFVSEGIEDITVDMEMKVLTGKVSHFSDIAIVPHRIVAGVYEDDRPAGYSLDQNYPNPFNPMTTIPFSLAESGMVTIEVYSILGRSVGKIVDDYMSSGTYNAIFRSTGLAAGTYIYTIKAGGYTETRQMLLLK
jgi:hypothetical protein